MNNQEVGQGNDTVSEAKSRRKFIASLAGVSATAALGSIGSVGAATTVNNQDSGSSAVTRRSLEGKVSLVTGAARGLGRASAVELARNGSKIILVDIAYPNAMFDELGYPLASDADLRETERLINSIGGECMRLVADVRELSQMEEAVSKGVERFGKLDVVVAAAGVGIANDKFTHYDTRKWKAVMDVNLYGVANTVYAAVDALKKSGEARVIIISSRAGRIGTGLPAYGSSKWAVTGLMKNLAIELGPHNIRVNCVAPGTADTDLPYYQNQLPRNEEGRAKLTEIQNSSSILPTGLIQPIDIAHVIVEAAGPATRTTTGATFDANGGSTARTSS